MEDILYKNELDSPVACKLFFRKRRDIKYSIYCVPEFYVMPSNSSISKEIKSRRGKKILIDEYLDENKPYHITVIGIYKTDKIGELLFFFLYNNKICYQSNIDCVFIPIY